MKPDEDGVLAALKQFADAVTAKMTALTAGEPEDQLRAPLEAFMEKVGHVLGREVVCTGETLLPGRLGKPDYAVHAGKLLAGYIELKAPGTGANPARFTGHNAEQWKRFRSLPNVIYCDGNDWGLYHNGEAVRPLVRLSGDVARDGHRAVKADEARALLGLLTDFLQWQPVVPIRPGIEPDRPEIDLAGLAALLAPLCRLLREDVADALKDSQSPLVQLAGDWRQLLFPDADDEQFADAYAQTVTFALLLARSEGADPLGLHVAVNALASEHSLLSRALQVLTDPNAQREISASLHLLVRVIGAMPTDALTGPRDPWLYFYEDFLAAYDPKLRKDAGAYYTPVEVVHAQVRLVHDLLTKRLGKALGFADGGVVTLDPAVGTGTYLLGVIDEALTHVQARMGQGTVSGEATALAENIHGFELMVGPFAVAELRVSRALRDRGATLPKDGTHIYLTDTLESPHTTPPQLPLYLKPIAEQHAKALRVKDEVPVIVCLGNPPYDRHEAADETNRARTGGWVRWGEEGKRPEAIDRDIERRDQRARIDRGGAIAIFDDFLQPALAAGHGVHAKNLYNLYVYFWRWALWKVFEHRTVAGPGVVSFISASSYLDGDAFCGMREHMRRLCDEIWILDLGGEGRGTRRSENVFAIQTPVAIAVAVRYGKPQADAPAKVHYARMDQPREEKLRALDAIAGFASVAWRDCPADWQSPFRPAGTGAYFDWPLLTHLFPWQHSGVECKRTWPIAPDQDTLRRRWRALLKSPDRGRAFRETDDRTVTGTYRVALTRAASAKPIADLPANAPVPPLVEYAFRSFDRQWIIADSRVMSRPRPNLWFAHGPKQVYVASQMVLALGEGPAMTAGDKVPDRHYFAGRGGKDTIPLYRDAAGKEANILPGLLDLLAEAYCRDRPLGGRRRPKPTARRPAPPSAEDFLAYVYGILAQPAFTGRFAEELGTRQLRVPITKDPALFEKVRAAGARLLWLHTYGERFVPKGKHRGHVRQGAARCTKAVPGDRDDYPDKFGYDPTTKTLRVGAGEFSPVAPEVFAFEVSGLKVVPSWLGYRMKNPKGKKTSPLDDISPERWPAEFTRELLELLWVLEATLAEYPTQAELLSAVCKGPCFSADELPPVPPASRKPPSRATTPSMFPESDDDDG